MYTLVITIHVIVCLILIAAILLQAGRGGGLAGLFGGGGTTQTIFGARASTFLTRATTVAAILFLLTCISLTVFSSRRVKSLMGGAGETEVAEQPLPEVAEEAVPEEIPEEENPPLSETEPQLPQE